MLLYLVLYLQDILGYSPLGTGVRVMFLPGAILVTARWRGAFVQRAGPAAHRARSDPGRGRAAADARAECGVGLDPLIPGMILGGLGVGLVNPPLASTAVGVVRPEQAGMASGINSTFRQVGIATGIALLGTLFSNKVQDEVLARVAAVPGCLIRARRSPRPSNPARSAGDRETARAFRPMVALITRSAFTSGLNHILLVAAIIALVSGVISLATIRTKDFARRRRARRNDRAHEAVLKLRLPQLAGKQAVDHAVAAGSLERHLRAKNALAGKPATLRDTLRRLVAGTACQLQPGQPQPPSAHPASSRTAWIAAPRPRAPGASQYPTAARP